MDGHVKAVLMVRILSGSIVVKLITIKNWEKESTNETRSISYHHRSLLESR
jgi:hypothetical protein